MRLLAIFAIGVTALFGSPTMGAAKSELPPETYEAILDSAKMKWSNILLYAGRYITLDERLLEHQSYDKEAAKLRRKREAQVKLMADYAQIYSALCK